MSAATDAINRLLALPSVTYESGPRAGLRTALTAVRKAEALEGIGLSATSPVSNLAVAVTVRPDGRIDVKVPHDAQVRYAEPPVAYEFVGVKFQEYDTPSEAAADAESTGWGAGQRVWTYRATQALKLTVGDRVSVPIGDNRVYRCETRVGTVVSLNMTDPTGACGYVKDVDSRA